MKKRKITMTKRLFVFLCVSLWFIIVLFSLYILKTGGHLKPWAAGLNEATQIKSVVIGEDGIVVSGAKVILTMDGKNNYLISDSNGQLVISNINYGEYSLSISASGYKDFSTTITVDGNGRNYSFRLVK